jgi:phosphoglycolate phosphatase-like HAD superfamily hydrolase
VTLFDAVREAAGSSSDRDPAYVRTIGELLATIDLAKPAAPSGSPSHGLMSRPIRSAPSLRAPPVARKPTVKEVAPLRELPALPAAATNAELRRRVQEYFEIGRRMGADFTDFEARSNAASLSGDGSSLEVVAREMFVHLLSSLAEEFEATLVQRNEVAQLIPTPSADVELDAVRESVRLGDLAGALRRLSHVRDELLRVEEEWQVGRILLTECDLLAQTIRELGGDPAPAQGPLEEGRKFLSKGRRSDAEQLLARAAVALWTVLEPRFFEDLRRIRDRMNDARNAGADIAPAVTDLREVATELRQRNFVGVLTAYRRLRAFADQLTPLGSAEVGAGVLAPAVRSDDPSA